ncbi:MAG: hypothetical protein IPG67_12525 [Acidobacteria bacterium]|nr:hypothetical protein [Acidobacteriota bacterium]
MSGVHQNAIISSSVESGEKTYVSPPAITALMIYQIAGLSLSIARRISTIF